MLRSNVISRGALVGLAVLLIGCASPTSNIGGAEGVPIRVAPTEGVKAPKGYAINPVRTSPKALDRYHNLCVTALEPGPPRLGAAADSPKMAKAGGVDSAGLCLLDPGP